MYKFVLSIDCPCSAFYHKHGHAKYINFILMINEGVSFICHVDTNYFGIETFVYFKSTYFSIGNLAGFSGLLNAILHILL